MAQPLKFPVAPPENLAKLNAIRVQIENTEREWGKLKAQECEEKARLAELQDLQLHGEFDHAGTFDVELVCEASVKEW